MLFTVYICQHPLAATGESLPCKVTFTVDKFDVNLTGTIWFEVSLARGELSYTYF